MKIETFIVTIKDGKIEFNSDSHRRLFQAYLNQFEGKYRLSVETLKNSRSDQQNRYYWMYLNLISEESGHTKEELHSLFKGKFLTQGITEVYGDKVRVIKSTTDLTVGEFCEYLVEISALTGVELPDTKEIWGYSYHKRNQTNAKKYS